MAIYKFTTEYQTGWRFPINRAPNKILFKSEWLKVQSEDGYANITIPAKYSWDGCSPKFKLFGRVWGTPDFQFTKRASLIHDALYQHAGRHYLTRGECDYAFLHAMVHRQDFIPPFWQFVVSNIYYAAVRVFGGRYWKKRGGLSR